MMGRRARADNKATEANPEKKVRYAVVGLGHIAQVAVLPAFRHAQRNSSLVSIVSDDRTKRRVIAKKYRLDHTYSYEIVGTKGQIRVNPAYEYAEGLRYELTVDGKKKEKAIGKRDQFAPELLYFSDCILNDRRPEPSGEEGMQDVRIVQALYRSAQTGRSIRIPAFANHKRPSPAQTIRRPGIRKPRLVKAVSASEE